MKFPAKFRLMSNPVDARLPRRQIEAADPGCRPSKIRSVAQRGWGFLDRANPSNT
jgi:hypothetical protein